MTPLLQREADFAEWREIDPHPRIALICTDCFKVLLFLAYSCVSPGSALGTGTVNLAIAMSTACPSLEQRGREGEEEEEGGRDDVCDFIRWTSIFIYTHARTIFPADVPDAMDETAGNAVRLPASSI